MSGLLASMPIGLPPILLATVGNTGNSVCPGEERNRGRRRYQTGCKSFLLGLGPAFYRIGEYYIDLDLHSTVSESITPIWTVSSPLCPTCQVPEAVDDYFLDCRRYQTGRTFLLHRLNQNASTIYFFALCNPAVSGTTSRVSFLLGS